MVRFLSALAAAAFVLGACANSGSTPDAGPSASRLRAMSFNLWGAGANDGTTIDATVAAIRAAAPDIVGLQETRAEGEVCNADTCDASGPSRAAEIAQALGWSVYEQAPGHDALWANAVMSRHPIEGGLTDDLGAIVTVEGRRVHVWNLHFTDYPYQPYQALSIPYGEARFISTERDAIAEADAARGQAATKVIAAIEAAGPAALDLVFGDFNEPSGRDWTQAAAAAGLHPFAVDFPTVKRFEALGFVDAYRAVHPDPVAAPGLTWTPTTAPDDPADHHDRIDYVFARAEGLVVTQAEVAGESAKTADIVVSPWPSDHRAVVAEITF